MILLVGGGGIPNYGDELIINNWLKWYHDSGLIDNQSMIVEGYRSSVLRNMFADRFPRARWSHTIREARVKHRSLDFWGALARGLNVANSTDDAGQHSFREASEASLMHIHGGGYINGKWPSHAFVLGLASAAREKSDTRAITTGIGISPLAEPDTDQRKILDRAIESFDFVEVRDVWSYEYLRRNLSGDRPNKIVLGLDDAFLYRVESTGQDHRTLHLALRDDPQADSIIERLTNKFVGSFDRHLFWVCKHTDAGAYVKVANRFRLFELAGTTQLVEDPRLGPNDTLITERFHPHLQAARSGASGVYWSGSEYYDTKHGSLVDLGSPFVADDGKEFGGLKPAKSPSKMRVDDPENIATKQGLARRALKLLE
ncbi:polysaccharide pyruvyl transferase family protein [Microbacterium suaedae]|uniref:polysaccharide pyruvyl transferase family protein n=1 Tax=Microbacterium suaedae TaxID=2067813 RepID=UPI000DA16E8C|nr:polysaccharide pyruvyl transferase family protein [Microbacterium suaedae]